jgi:hypothetical protein
MGLIEKGTLATPVYFGMVQPHAILNENIPKWLSLETPKWWLKRSYSYPSDYAFAQLSVKEKIRPLIGVDYKVSTTEGWSDKRVGSLFLLCWQLNFIALGAHLQTMVQPTLLWSHTIPSNTTPKEEGKEFPMWDEARVGRDKTLQFAYFGEHCAFQVKW